jgi:hypothetical protein
MRPAESGEHRFKASDIRAVAPRITPSAPVFLQRGRATNDRIGSSRANRLKFAKSICAECNGTRTQPYDFAWQRLLTYLLATWPAITRRGRFDLSKAFPGGTRAAALAVHLFFVKLFGCKIQDEGHAVDLATFSRSLLQGVAHPEVSITFANSRVTDHRILMYESELHSMSAQIGDLHGALWLYLVHPIAVKVGYIKAGAPLHLVGNPWHPSRPGKLIKLSPYKGATEPDAGPKALIETSS